LAKNPLRRKNQTSVRKREKKRLLRGQEKKKKGGERGTTVKGGTKQLRTEITQFRGESPAENPRQKAIKDTKGTSTARAMEKKDLR